MDDPFAKVVSQMEEIKRKLDSRPRGFTIWEFAAVIGCATLGGLMVGTWILAAYGF